MKQSALLPNFVPHSFPNLRVIRIFSFYLMFDFQTLRLFDLQTRLDLPTHTLLQSTTLVLNFLLPLQYKEISRWDGLPDLTQTCVTLITLFPKLLRQLRKDCRIMAMYGLWKK